MMILGQDKEKAEIDYPCQWIYKVIGEDSSLLHKAISDACGMYSPKINHSQTSSKGKYQSFTVDVRIENEAVRLEIYEKLKTAPAVKIVL